MAMKQPSLDHCFKLCSPHQIHAKAKSLDKPHLLLHLRSVDCRSPMGPLPLLLALAFGIGGIGLEARPAAAYVALMAGQKAQPLMAPSTRCPFSIPTNRRRLKEPAF